MLIMQEDGGSLGGDHGVVQVQGYSQDRCIDCVEEQWAVGVKIALLSGACYVIGMNRCS